MKLYDMLDVTLYTQPVCIYVTNAYDQNMSIFSGTVGDARTDDDVWCHLMDEVEHYECGTGILVIEVKDKHYEDRMELYYSNSGRWGKDKSQRPWRYSIEVEQEVREMAKKGGMLT